MATPVLQKLGTFGPLRCQEAWALDRLLREARVFEAVCELSRRWEMPATSAQEGKGCVGPGSRVSQTSRLALPHLHACLTTCLLCC